ncbi:MAG: hypothetical protein ABIJ00_05510 [Candidatus Eisenbacteria bacterium]
MAWVWRLWQDLRQQGFDVAIDFEENPKPPPPGEDADWYEKLKYEMYARTADYLGSSQRPARRLPGGMIVRPSPAVPTDLPPEWDRYLDVARVFALIPVCHSIILINTVRYLAETASEEDEFEAGWVLEEFQVVLRCLMKKGPKRVISVLREGNRFHTRAEHWLFPMVDFREHSDYGDSLNVLVEYLDEPLTPPDWRAVAARTAKRVRCSQCDLDLPYTEPPLLVCCNCSEVRPPDRLLCHKCGWDQWHPLLVMPTDPARGLMSGVITMPRANGKVVKVPISNACFNCHKGLISIIDAQ